MISNNRNGPVGDGAAPLPEPAPIAEHAIATLRIAGYPDFLTADGRAAWVTTAGRVEKLSSDHLEPVATVRMPSPCGGMVVAFGAYGWPVARNLHSTELSV